MANKNFACNSIFVLYLHAIVYLYYMYLSIFSFCSLPSPSEPTQNLSLDGVLQSTALGAFASKSSGEFTAISDPITNLNHNLWV